MSRWSLALFLLSHFLLAAPLPCGEPWQFRAIGLSPAAFPNYVSLQQRRFLETIACGPLALLAVLEHYGIPVSDEERRTVVALAGHSGTDLLSLKRKAQELGLHALGVGISSDELNRLGMPAIVYLSGRGFAAVTDYRPKAFLLTYPGDEPRWVKTSEFQERFGEHGVALLLSRSAINTSQIGASESPEEETLDGSSLRFQASLIAIGKIHDSAWSRDVQLENRGSGNLEIVSVDVSCSCMQAVVDLKSIAPGAKATLSVRGSQGQYGQFLHTVAVTTNDPRQPIATIKVSGYREPEFLFPQPELLVRTVARQPFEAETRFLSPPGVLADGISVTGLPDTLTAEIAETSVPGEHRLVIRSPGLSLAGWHNLAVGVRRIGQTAPDVALLHLGVEVLPALAVRPMSVRLRHDRALGTWSRRIRISSPLEGGLAGLQCQVLGSELAAAISTALEPDIASEGDTKVFVLILSGDALLASRACGNSNGVVKIDCAAGSTKLAIRCEQPD